MLRVALAVVAVALAVVLRLAIAAASFKPFFALLSFDCFILFDFSLGLPFENHYNS